MLAAISSVTGKHFSPLRAMLSIKRTHTKKGKPLSIHVPLNCRRSSVVLYGRKEVFKDISSFCDSAINITKRETIHEEINEMHKIREVTGKDKLDYIPGMVSVTSDASASRVLKASFK